MAKEFDPEGVGIKNGHIFSLPYQYNEAELVLLPVPWEVTVSFKAGTANGPKGILDASTQIDLFCNQIGNHWTKGIYMLDISEEIQAENNKLRPRAAEYLKILEEHGPAAISPQMKDQLAEINAGCEKTRKWVFDQCDKHLKDDKAIGIIGGDHSVPLGYIQALAQKHDKFGILQIDAHADLRVDYEGFPLSHASIMNNALKIDQVKKLIQVGIRDYSSGENDRILSDNRIDAYSAFHIRTRQYEGGHWGDICNELISELPDKVYISFDIDGLSSENCPNTGTVVPGGPSFNMINYLIDRLVNSGKKIIGFDLCEVNGNFDWDSNVGMRVLFILSNALLATKK